ncbi:MAG: class II D-tagatose-bisphosphate aldolase non-catalytic subunit [Oscillospiraceae bacterium]
MLHPILKILNERRQGKVVGIPSYCTANRKVIETILRDAAKHGRTVLIEATANQVDQFGGYTGMKPKDYVRFIEEIAAQTGCDMRQILLGGDHLGPLTFCKEPEAAAMDKAEALVQAYVAAGFTKIHLDTSMKVADDPAGALDKRICARRGARLCRAAEEEFTRYRLEHPEALHPVYVIGSEVPIPGGATEQEDRISVTNPEDLRETLAIYLEEFNACGLQEAWQYIIAVVVQPGVEFGDDAVFLYDHEKAQKLVAMLADYPNLVFEGHSTDYQTEACLRHMVEDGIAILKVGPALTFGYRDALFALSHIEQALIPAQRRANFPAALEQAMLNHPENWQKHYHGTPEEQRLARSYSLSDRARYYIGMPEVVEAIDRMMANLKDVHVPLGLIYQYFPQSAPAVLTGACDGSAEKLLEREIMHFVNDYIAAAGE